jgi:hypothetical protein
MQFAFSRWHRANGMQLLQGFFAALPTLAASCMAIGHILSRTRLACPHRSPTEALSVRQPRCSVSTPTEEAEHCHGGTRGRPLRRCLCLVRCSCTAATLLWPLSPSSPFHIIISRSGPGWPAGPGSRHRHGLPSSPFPSPASPPSAPAACSSSPVPRVRRSPQRWLGWPVLVSACSVWAPGPFQALSGHSGPLTRDGPNRLSGRPREFRA